ncbi:hypothetical protein [Kistimonas scapharcae]|uniref:hypothetical protein n=1 Tax=Kistimonas scapharcae TaxID=1036133 RepID=UPI0031F04BA2
MKPNDQQNLGGAYEPRYNLKHLESMYKIGYVLGYRFGCGRVVSTAHTDATTCIPETSTSGSATQAHSSNIQGRRISEKSDLASSNISSDTKSPHTYIPVQSEKTHSSALVEMHSAIAQDNTPQVSEQEITEWVEQPELTPLIQWLTNHSQNPITSFYDNSGIVLGDESEGTLCFTCGEIKENPNALLIRQIIAHQEHI